MNVAEIVTSQIIAGLKKGHIPWRKPWSGVFPHNFVTGHTYSGVNPVLCSVYCEMKGWKYPLFASFQQIRCAGGYVRKGERGNPIVFTRQVLVKEKNPPEDPQPEDLKPLQVHLLRFYTVFNLQQTDLDPSKYVQTFTHNPQGSADEILARRSPKVLHGGSRAFYSPTEDAIHLPNPDTFSATSAYYLTAFHELTHWTGHTSRLDRLTTTHFGTGEYSQEELVAEIGANMLAQTAGVVPEVTRNSQAYINNWLKRLQDDVHFVIKAASAAQTAFDYMMS